MSKKSTTKQEAKSKQPTKSATQANLSTAAVSANRAKKTSQAKFSISDLLSFSWNKTKENYATLLILAVSVTFIIWLGEWFVGELTRSVPAVGLLFQLAWTVASLIFSMGMLRSLLYINRGKKVSLESFQFSGKQIINFLVGSILVGLIVTIGFVALIIPGIYFMLRYEYVNYLIVDKNMSPSEAMSRSSELTDGIKLKLLGFMLLLGLLNLGGLLLMGLGLLITVPVSYLAQSRLYDVLSEQK